MFTRSNGGRHIGWRLLRECARTFAGAALLAAAACQGAPPPVEPGPAAFVPVAPGTTTQISVQKQAAVDTILDEDATGTVEVTVARPDRGTVDLVAAWTCKKGVSTRRSIAEAIAAELQKQLVAAGLPDSLVTTAGCGVFVTKTPDGFGKNTGKPRAPLLSPHDPAPGAVHTLITTTDKDGK